MNKVITWIVVIVVVVGGIFFLNKGRAPKDTSPVKVGFIGPLTGDLGNVGKNAQAAVQIAVEEVNADGGVLGRTLEVVYEDGQCGGAGAANAASKLINTDKVVAILGGTCSGETLAIAPIAEAAKVPELSYCSTAPAITNSGDFIFRDVPSDNFQANFAAEYLAGKNLKKVALIYVKNDWGLGLKDALQSALSTTGGTLVAEESYDPTSKDLRSQLAKIKAVAPDAIYFAGYTDGTIAGLKQAKELGITAQFFGADAWDDTKIWSSLGSVGEGAMYTLVGTNSSDDFKVKMQAKLGAPDIIYCSNYAYDGLKILAAAIDRANSTEGIAVKDALYKTNYTSGVSSESVKFDANGDPTEANYAIKVIKGGVATDLVE